LLYFVHTVTQGLSVSLCVFVRRFNTDMVKTAIVAAG
jgi:hypothetical protein